MNEPTQGESVDTVVVKESNAGDQQRQLHAKLWAVANELRGKMDASDFKNYMLGFLFYRFLSTKFQVALVKELIDDEIITDPNELNKVDEEVLEDYREEVRGSLGYGIDKGFLYSDIIADIAKNEDILIKLGTALKNVEESAVGEAKDDFDGLFTAVDLNSKSLGVDQDEREKVLRSILSHIDSVDFGDVETEIDILGDAYEFLISRFAATSGKSGGEFFSPQEVATLLAKLVSAGDSTRVGGSALSVYDPTCGSGSLLLRVKRELTGVNVFKGQELNSTTYNLARMNMLLHGVAFDQFEITNGNTLEKPAHKESGTFDLVVANPPFSAKWDSKGLEGDPRFSYVKTAPSSKADWAFVQHMLYLLKDDGAMAVVLPHGPLFRGGAESDIRKFVVANKNWLDCVIGLPPNLFYGTSIPAVICVFKKCRTSKDVLFVDASKDFDKGKNQNRLTSSNIEHILSVFKARAVEDKFSVVASEKMLKDNDYNLNISRYVDSSPDVETVDINAVNVELAQIEEELATNETVLAEFFSELGLEWNV